MKAALYVRGSKDEIDLLNQLDPLRTLCAARTWEPVVYEETETGDDERARRPVFEGLLEDARRGVIRIICVAGLDRLTRRGQRLVELFESFEKWRVTVVSLREGDKWTEMDAPMRRMVVGVIGMVAEMEMLNLRKRTKAGLDKARRRGTRSGKPIGRPRANQLLLGAAARRVQSGESLRKASKEAGVSEASLRRYLQALTAPRNDEGPGGAPAAPAEPSGPSVRQNPPSGGATSRHQKSTG